MSAVTLIIILIVVGVGALICMPKIFTINNARAVSQANFEKYVSELKLADKQQAGHLNEINENLNLINYWLKTGSDPNNEGTDPETAKNLVRFHTGGMNRDEAKKFAAKLKLDKQAQEEAHQYTKSLRHGEFEVRDMEPVETGITQMKFFYDPDANETIYYCVTPEALEKQFFRNVIYFTTARSTQIPVNFPHKYDGAQMLSLYKHPSQTIWFLKNWKIIREAMEAGEEAPEPLDDAIKEFGL